MRLVGLVAYVGIALGCNDELEERVGKLEKEVTLVREERASRDLKITKLLAEADTLERKVEKLEKDATKPPTYPSYKAPGRGKPDPAKVYSVPIDPRDPIE